MGLKHKLIDSASNVSQVTDISNDPRSALNTDHGICASVFGNHLQIAYIIL